MLRTGKTIASNSSETAEKPKRTRGTARISDVLDIYDGKIRIYRTTHSGDVWQLRMYIQNEQKYIRKSLKTRDKDAAVKIAQDEFIKYSAKILNGEKIFSISAKDLRERYLEYVMTLVGEAQLSKGRAGNIKTFTKHFMDFVGSTTKIQNISHKFFQGYRSHRQKKVPGITMTVVVNESITIKQMYRWAINEGFIQPNYTPDFGRIKVDKNEVRRESFTIEDYKALVDIGKNWYKKVPPAHPNRDEEIYYRRSIQDFIVLMGNFGFRTGELLLSRFRHVRINSKDNTATVLIPAENTKVRNQREITGRRSEVFKRRMQYSPHTEPDDFVFSHYRKNAMMTKELLYEYYNALTKEVKIHHTNFDDTKTLYSLRHFWITIQLLAGKVDVYKIARYAGTSLQQIQKHYDSVKDAEVSKEITAVKFRFDENNEIELFDPERLIQNKKDSISAVSK